MLLGGTDLSSYIFIMNSFFLFLEIIVPVFV